MTAPASGGGGEGDPWQGVISRAERTWFVDLEALWALILSWMNWTEDMTKRLLERDRDAYRAVISDWGRRMFEQQDNPVAWAGQILGEVTIISPGVTEVDAILRCAEDARQWPAGHERFQAARRRYLAEQPRQGAETPVTIVLNFAELVAKIAYNATTPHDPFDEDTGWWIAPTAAEIAEATGEASFKVRVAQAIGG